ncbi:MAG TPA: RDD family protein [Terracidiphilus sp.]
MSTQPNFTPQWKEEVSRRIAAHKNRQASTADSETSSQSAAPGASRAAEAAARVAARYAKAPSYSQLQAEEARVAVRHAEIATKVALQAQAAAESALAGLHAAAQEQPSRGPAVVQPIAPPVATAPPIPQPAHPQGQPHAQLITDVRTTERTPVAPAVLAAAVEPERQSFAIRWDPDLPVRPAERKATPAPRRVQEEFELSVEDWWSPAEATENLRNKPIEFTEAEPEHANLIQFPRELVATRKIRPRLAEGSLTEAEGQLSIFEVDPGAISTALDAPSAGQDAHASIWNRPDWSGIRLDNQPVELLATAPTADQAQTRFPVAPMGLRLMAAAVDGALILASFVSAGFLVAHQFSHPPEGKAGEIIGVVLLALIGLLYYAFFFAFPVCTPGMRYAGIGLCTFDDQSPTRAQLRRRLGAMALSLLPVGLGIAWSIFDDDHMSWHDRYSHTYLRKL